MRSMPRPVSSRTCLGENKNLGHGSRGDKLGVTMLVRVRVRVRVTLRLAVYRQSVRLGAKPPEVHDQRFILCS
jgi:hypothetical protein